MQEQVSNAVESAKEAAHNVGEKVSELFQGNPFSTPVGRKIELATDANNLATENWGLNMEICDYINNTAEGARDAIRALRKRLQTQMAKNNAIVMFTLTVLETCVKNCDERFHLLVCQKDFIMDLVKLVGPKFDAPQVVQERVLSLIQSWADAFRGQPALNGVCLVYDDLKSKGVEFPMADLDAMAPIKTPQRTVYSSSSSNAPNVSDGARSSSSHPQSMMDEGSSLATGPIEANSAQLTKLRNDMDIVQGNVNILQELLSEMAPGREDVEDLELAKDLSLACLEMQRRITALVQVITNEEVTSELLSMNDQLNAVLHKYERHMGNRTAAQDHMDNRMAAQDHMGNRMATQDHMDKRTAAPDHMDNRTAIQDHMDNRMAAQDNLIQFDSTPSVGSQLASLKVNEDVKNPSVVETSYRDNSTGLDQTSAGLHTAAHNKTQPIDEREAEEMANWLKAQEEQTASEFDSFLNGRTEKHPKTKEDDDGL